MKLKTLLFAGLTFCSTLCMAQLPKYVAAGYPFSNTAALIVTSADAKTWTTVYEGTHSAFAGLAFGNGTYVALTEKIGVLYSTDGKNWQEANLPAELSKSNADTKGVAYGNGMFVIVGSNHLILTSTNGKDWSKWGQTMAEKKAATEANAAANRTKTNALNKLAGNNREALNNSGVKQQATTEAGDGGIDPETAIGRTHFFAVNFIDGQFIIMGNKDRIARFIVKGNNLEFTGHFAGGADLVPTTRSAAFGNNTYVVVGTQAAYVSADKGATWKTSKIGAEGWRVAFGKNIFAMVNTFGQVWHSKDGLTWTKTTIETGKLFDLIFTGNEFIGIGEKNLVRSTDGITWTVTEMTFDKKFMMPTFKGIVAQ